MAASVDEDSGATTMETSAEQEAALAIKVGVLGFNCQSRSSMCVCVCVWCVLF